MHRTGHHQCGRVEQTLSWDVQDKLSRPDSHDSRQMRSGTQICKHNALQAKRTDLASQARAYEPGAYISFHQVLDIMRQLPALRKAVYCMVCVMPIQAHKHSSPASCQRRSFEQSLYLQSTVHASMSGGDHSRSSSMIMVHWLTWCIHQQNLKLTASGVTLQGMSSKSLASAAGNLK